MTPQSSHQSGKSCNDIDGNDGNASGTLDTLFELSNVVGDCGNVIPTSNGYRDFMVPNMVFNSDVLADDILTRGSSQKVVEGSARDESNKELLDQIKLKGVAMAEARRNLAAAKNKFHLPEIKTFLNESEKKESVSNRALPSAPCCDEGGIAALLASRMKENYFS